MIRLLIFSLVRFFFIALVFYAILTFFKGVLRALGGGGKPSSRRSRQYPQSGNPPKTTVEYTDVKDAKFTELPDKQREEKQAQQT
jgi:hypothetical protein